MHRTVVSKLFDGAASATPSLPSSDHLVRVDRQGGAADHTVVVETNPVGGIGTTRRDEYGVRTVRKDRETLDRVVEFVSGVGKVELEIGRLRRERVAHDRAGDTESSVDKLPGRRFPQD